MTSLTYDAEVHVTNAAHMHKLLLSRQSSLVGIKIVNNSHQLILQVLVTTTDAQWEGMGDVGSARYEPALLPPCPTIRVLSYSN